MGVTLSGARGGGAAVPVKFTLGGDMGLDIFATGYPLSRQIPNHQETMDGV